MEAYEVNRAWTQELEFLATPRHGRQNTLAQSHDPGAYKETPSKYTAGSRRISGATTEAPPGDPNTQSYPDADN